MNPLASLAAVGFSSKKLLNFLIKKIPSLEPRITSALAAGLSADKLVEFLKKPANFEKIKQQVRENQIHPSQAENPLVQSEEIKRRSLSQDTGTRLGKSIKSGLGTAVKFGSTYAAARALPLLTGTNKQGLPPIGANPIANSPMPSPGPITNPNQPIQPPQNLIHQAKQPSTNVPVPLPNQPIEPALPQQLIGVAPSEVIRNAQLNQLIDSMANDKVSPEDISDYIANSYPEHAKHVEEKTREPLVNSIYRYLGKKQKKPGLVQGLENQLNQQYGNQNGTVTSSNQSQDQIQPSTEGPIVQEGANIIQNQNVVERENRQTFEKAKKENGDVVQLPDGEIGTIESIKKDHAVVDINGKKRPVKLDQLEDIPIQKKDLADLHEDLIKGIEEEIGSDVSRNVNWAGYDPKTNRLSYLPHDGALYVYDDIDAEDAKLLTSILSTRKSSGGNFIGPWIAGTKSPIGAAMSSLIKRLQAQRGGKGNEYSGKFETIYSHLEPAVKAAKAKKKKKKK